MGHVFTLLIRLLQPQKPRVFRVASPQGLSAGPSPDLVSVSGVGAVRAFPLREWTQAAVGHSGAPVAFGEGGLAHPALCVKFCPRIVLTVSVRLVEFVWKR